MRANTPSASYTLERSKRSARSWCSRSDTNDWKSCNTVARDLSMSKCMGKVRIQYLQEIKHELLHFLLQHVLIIRSNQLTLVSTTWYNGILWPFADKCHKCPPDQCCENTVDRCISSRLQQRWIGRLVYRPLSRRWRTTCASGRKRRGIDCCRRPPAGFHGRLQTHFQECSICLWMPHFNHRMP